MNPSEALSTVLDDRVAVTGGEVACTVVGHGPPVVLVHGTPTSSLVWDGVVRVLAQSHRVHVFDLLGFGQSERSVDQHVSIRRHARVLADLVAHWQIERPVLVGHDIGGATVLRAHLLEGVDAAALVLVDAVALRPWITPPSRHIRANLDAYRSMPHAVWREVARSHLRHAFARPVTESTFEALWAPWDGRLGQELWLRNVAQFDEQDTVDFEDGLGEIDVPTLVVWGERDEWIDLDRGRDLAARIPGAELAIVPEAGHFSMLDQPDRVGTLIADHARRHAERSPRSRRAQR